MLYKIPSVAPNVKHVRRMDPSALLLAIETEKLEIVNVIVGQAERINVNQKGVFTLAVRQGLQAT